MGATELLIIGEEHRNTTVLLYKVFLCEWIEPQIYRYPLVT